MLAPQHVFSVVAVRSRERRQQSHPWTLAPMDTATTANDPKCDALQVPCAHRVKPASTGSVVKQRATSGRVRKVVQGWALQFLSQCLADACAGLAALASCTNGICGEFVCTTSNYCCECEFGRSSGLCSKVSAIGLTKSPSLAGKDQGQKLSKLSCQSQKWSCFAWDSYIGFE
ncbi:hypothetical protein ANCCAN_25373 [Ancylostoma caninum]|uniref:Uncharacterized protein n=1 Tax=Ancylostoma caninum TaxID=29170 RepID=A0A368FCZ7_ANCCA|nr:hypothetical protein ANCCAN_25373 [Ancylostoma caninum]